MKILTSHVNIQSEKGRLAVKAVAIATVIAIAVSLCGFDGSCDKIRENVLRLHVLANSDEAHDQLLKLSVRDAILTASEDILGGCRSEAEAAEAARNGIEVLTAAAERTVFESGYTYPVTVSVENTWFEDRVYDDFTLPSGSYEAVRVVIGNGEGHNWWCVMFPSVCLPAASDGKISDVLDGRETDIVSHPKKYTAKLKTVELFGRLQKSIASWFD